MCTATYLHYNNLQCIQCFWSQVENLKTCEQGIFHRVRNCEKPCEMEVCLAAACMLLYPPPPKKKKKITMLKSDFCPARASEQH